MHGSNPFKGPGDNEGSRHSSSHGKKPEPSSADKSLVHSKTGGGGRAAAGQKKVDEDQAHWDEEEKRRQQQADTEPPPPTVDRTVVKISNIKWDSQTVTIGGTAFVSMDVSIPPEHAHATKITCALEQQMPGGHWKSVTAHMKPCDAKDGKARCELTVPEPLKNEDGTAPAKVHFRLVAKHAYSSPAQGPPVEAVPGNESPYDSVIYYAPMREEYLCLDTEEEFKSLLAELALMEKLQGLTLKAMEAKDAEERKKIQEEIDKQTEELFDKEVIGDASAAVEELLLIRRNKRWGDTKAWVYFRPNAKKNKTKIKGRWRKDKDAVLKKNLEDLLKKAPGSKELSPLFESEFKAKLFETDPLKHQAMVWGKKKDNGTKDGEGFTFSGEAAVCRFAVNFTAAEASVNLKEKKIHIGSNGSLSLGALEGKVEGKYPLPEKGVNLLTFLKQTTHLDAFIEKGRQCLLRLNVSFGAQAFAGFTVSEALSLPDIDLSRVKAKGKKKQGGPHVTAGASAEGFVGGRVSGELSVSPEWARKDGDKFESLGSCGVEGGASAGLGGQAEWEIEYKNGTFHVKAGAGLTFGLGCKSSFSFELSVEEGFHFVGYLLHCMDYHFVFEIKKAAFDAYKNYSFTLMTLGHKALTAEKAIAVDIITDFSGWLSNLGDDLQKVKRSLFESSVATGTLSNVPPEALGQALITIMQTREQDDFRSIMVILNATVRPGANIKTDPSANHKLKWTLRSVSSLLSPDEDRTATEAKKGAAMQAGIKKIEDFGFGIGYNDLDGTPAKQNITFLEKFSALLTKNGIV